MDTLSYPADVMTCGKCGNDDPIKFLPERSVPGTGNPLLGINLRCVSCDTLYDMSLAENQPD